MILLFCFSCLVYEVGASAHPDRVRGLMHASKHIFCVTGGSGSDALERFYACKVSLDDIKCTKGLLSCIC